jgi:hypothetical protein
LGVCTFEKRWTYRMSRMQSGKQPPQQVTTNPIPTKSLTFCGCPGTEVDLDLGSGWHVQHATICFQSKQCIVSKQSTQFRRNQMQSFSINDAQVCLRRGGAIDEVVAPASRLRVWPNMFVGCWVTTICCLSPRNESLCRWVVVWCGGG